MLPFISFVINEANEIKARLKERNWSRLDSSAPELNLFQFPIYSTIIPFCQIASEHAMKRTADIIDDLTTRKLATRKLLNA